MKADHYLVAWLPVRSRPLVESGIYGLAAGLAAVLFDVATYYLYSHTFPRIALWSSLNFALASFGLVVGTSLLSGLLLSRFAPEAAGSGIPQLKLAFWKDFGYVPFRVLWVKFIAGVLSVGGGSSLGREGPSVQIAGAVASNLAGVLGIPKTGRRRAAATGAAAGLAATFNTPLASIAFVLEEILGNLNSSLLGSVVVAAILGAWAVHACVGSQPAFILPLVQIPSLTGHLLVPLVAVCATLSGILFQRGALGLRRAFQRSRLQAIPHWLRPASGALFTWAIGASVFLIYGKLGVFGLGYEDLSDSLGGKIIGVLPFVLLAGKMAATVFSYGSGGCGGIFAPSLFFGSMTGCVVAESLRALGLPLDLDDRIFLNIIGMSACLAAVVRAPCTSILIVFEMTQEFSLVPALLVGGILSQALCRWIQPSGFYEEVLEDDGHLLSTVVPPRDLHEWQNYPVSAIATFQPALLPDLDRPTLEAALQAHPYTRLIYQQGNDLPRILFREEIINALAQNRPVELREAPSCLRTAPIVKAERLLVENESGIVLILDRPGGKVTGLITFHDLLRAEQNLAAEED